MYIYLEKQKLKKKIVIITNHRSIIFYQDETKPYIFMAKIIL